MYSFAHTFENEGLYKYMHYLHCLRKCHCIFSRSFLTLLVVYEDGPM
jgi:hypothetical protein